MEREAAGGSSSRESREALDPEDVRTYRAHLDEAAEGHAHAQFNVGTCFYQGKGVARDLKEAVRWFRKAAKKGNATAQLNLAYCLKDGVGVARDEAQVVIWLRKAADQGYAPAQAGLGFCLQNGEGVEKDAAQAIVWYRKAAEQGHAEAQCNLGACLHEGMGVARDAEQALVWYRKAAEQRHASAQFNLGLLLLEGAEGMPKDARAGARSLGAAAQQGHTKALAALAQHAGEREVAMACCLGCGATAQQACSRCLVARFCSQACVVHTWPVHKLHCRRWQAEAQAAAEGSGA